MTNDVKDWKQSSRPADGRILASTQDCEWDERVFLLLLPPCPYPQWLLGRGDGVEEEGTRERKRNWKTEGKQRDLEEREEKPFGVAPHRSLQATTAQAAGCRHTKRLIQNTSTNCRSLVLSLFWCYITIPHDQHLLTLRNPGRDEVRAGWLESYSDLLSDWVKPGQDYQVKTEFSIYYILVIPT